MDANCQLPTLWKLVACCMLHVAGCTGPAGRAGRASRAGRAGHAGLKVIENPETLKH